MLKCLVCSAAFIHHGHWLLMSGLVNNPLCCHCLHSLCLQELCAEVPGLFSLGPKGELVVGEARQHEKQLEKVCSKTVRFACATMGCLECIGCPML